MGKKSRSKNHHKLPGGTTVYWVDEAAEIPEWYIRQLAMSAADKAISQIKHLLSPRPAEKSSGITTSQIM